LQSVQRWKIWEPTRETRRTWLKLARRHTPGSAADDSIDTKRTDEVTVH